MSLTFTPSNAIDMSKEKEWAASLGMLDWDATRIVFTKRSLIEFLRITGTTVDPNFSNISKLPSMLWSQRIDTILIKLTEFATFGKLSEDAQTSVAAANVSGNSDAFKPTRRVRDVPGGKHTDIFGEHFQNEADALANAPPKDILNKIKESEFPASPPIPQSVTTTTENEEESGFNFSSQSVPSRRVRTNPGGNSTMGNLWDPVQEEFKPTRRVRQGPGGTDQVGSLF
ncbi:hypothetical protein E1B28_008585 [Marasmius oreades]|uniref:Uncharacterized protein n=1 Tax=Marasmius oreades TaxID=181124 RepID=A0A9P7S0A9_9AGAR|nr:uncharacterized protein E1B28_008585 [Marasmius oreades]KAG7092218.1 hypothetical protein E1B28_008585 [Marasmius oreades]